MGRWREASHASVGKESAALPRRRRPCARGALESNRGGPREHYSRGHGPGEAHVLDPIARTIRGGRGAGENTNVIRQCLPKGCNRATFDDAFIQHIEDKPGNRPRKRLGFRTPQEVFERSFKRAALRS